MRTKNSIKNIFTSLISLFILITLNFILSKVFIEQLGIEKNGLKVVLINIMSILSISELGISGAINYNLYKPILDKDYKKISIIMTLYKKCYRIIGIIILILSLSIAYFIPNIISNSTLTHEYIVYAFIMYSINTVITYFLSYARNLFYGFQHLYITNIIDFIFRSIRIILQIFLLYKYKSYYLFILVNIIFDFITNFIVFSVCKRRYSKVNFNEKDKNKEIVKNVAKDVKSLSAIQVTYAMVNFTDTIIISKFEGIIETGLFANYKIIYNQLVNIINSIYNSLGASIGNLIAENNKEKIEKSLYNIEYLTFFLAMFCFTGLITFTQQFITIWLGKKYLLSTSVVLLLSINLYFLIQRQCSIYFLRTGGYHKKMVIPTIIEAILNLILSISLVFKYGIVGVLVGTVISCFFGFICNSIILYKEFNLKYKKYILKQILFLIISIISVIVIKMISSIFNFSVLCNFIITAFIFLVIMISCMLLFIIFNKNLIDIKNKIIIFLKKKEK